MSREEYGTAFARGFRRTVKFLVSRGARIESAEEASQAAWVCGWERLCQLRNPQLLNTWVNTIALNCYRRIIKREKGREALRDMPGTTLVNLLALDLAKILQLCEEPHRKLLEQRLAGRSINEMAHDLGTTNAAVRIRLNRARRKARIAFDLAA
jgi:DNA-directed RNA polymerase specialized sigma24 family protein